MYYKNHAWMLNPMTITKIKNNLFMKRTVHQKYEGKYHI